MTKPKPVVRWVVWHRNANTASYAHDTLSLSWDDAVWGEFSPQKWLYRAGWRCTRVVLAEAANA